MNNIHKNKLTLYEWYNKEWGEGDSLEQSTANFNEMLINDSNHIHSGDCTQDSCPCELCMLEGFLEEYREYYLKEKIKMKEEKLRASAEDVFPELFKCKGCQARDEYIELLQNEISDLIGLAHVHGWKSTRVEAGAEARKKIEEVDK